MFRGHSDYYGCDVVIERGADGELVLTMGELVDGRPAWRLPLHCIEVDAFKSTSTFVYPTTGENAVSHSPIRLHSRMADGHVLSIADAWLDQVGVGEETGSGVGVIQRSE